ncbi:MAG TPA: hypothetical protein VGD37_33295 [Kofleriaceae bacterium]
MESAPGPLCKDGAAEMRMRGRYRRPARDSRPQSGGGTTNGDSSCFVGGLYCGFRCTGTGAPAVVRHCASGCAVRPGNDDTCR